MSSFSIIEKIRQVSLIVVILLVSADVTNAQQKDSVLNEVKIPGRRRTSSDERLNAFSPGQKVKAIDSATLQQYQLQNLGSLLTQQVPVFVKSYGFNGLATLNFRGSSAAQSAVLWNGVPIQNAALGIADVSILPVLFMSRVNIVYGGSAAMWGSGNVGGALLLESETPVFDTGKRALSFSGGAGSFGQYLGGLAGSISGKRWYFSANVFAQTAQNSFPYTDNHGLRQDMPNSRLQGNAAQVQAAYKIHTGNVISLSAWYQQYDRHIPPALFEAYSDKKQTDGSMRVLAAWDRKTAKNAWYAKSSVIRDEIAYTDTAIRIKTDNIVYQYYQEIGWKKRFHEYGQVLLFMPLQISWLQNPATDTERQNKVALAGAYDVRIFDQRLDMAVNAREEVIDAKSVFLPGGDASFALNRWLSVRVNVQKTYRVPTLNELYYFPGGNTGLRPEQGWSEDAGYTARGKTGRFSIYHDLSVFTRDIHDWIYWVGGAIWTPHNIAEVRSRGVETENYATYTLGKWTFHLGINTAYVLATTVSSYVQNDGSIGRQIPYAPRYNGQANVGFTFRKLSFNYNHTYTGYRFTTVDESEYILPYQTGNVQLMYNTLIKSHVLQFTGQSNNIWNEQYQVVAFRPMPGRNWLLGFKVGLF